MENLEIRNNLATPNIISLINKDLLSVNLFDGCLIEHQYLAKYESDKLWVVVLATSIVLQVSGRLSATRNCFATHLSMQ